MNTRLWIRTGVLGVILLLAACGNDPSVQIPTEMMGRWETGDEPYTDRFFEIGPQTLKIDTGEGPPPPMPIVGVAAEPQGAATLWQLRYESAPGVTAIFRLLHDPGANTLRLLHRTHVTWKRVSS